MVVLLTLYWLFQLRKSGGIRLLKQLSNKLSVGPTAPATRQFFMLDIEPGTSGKWEEFAFGGLVISLPKHSLSLSPSHSSNPAMLIVFNR